MSDFSIKSRRSFKFRLCLKQNAAVAAQFLTSPSLRFLTFVSIFGPVSVCLCVLKNIIAALFHNEATEFSCVQSDCSADYKRGNPSHKCCPETGGQGELPEPERHDRTRTLISIPAESGLTESVFNPCLHVQPPPAFVE